MDAVSGDGEPLQPPLCHITAASWWRYCCSVRKIRLGGLSLGLAHKFPRWHARVPELPHKPQNLPRTDIFFPPAHRGGLICMVSFLMISTSCLGEWLHWRMTAGFTIKFSVSRLSILFYFFLMGTNCSWQHSGWSNISPNVKGLTTNKVWPYQEPGPIHLKADLLSPCATTLPASSTPRLPRCRLPSSNCSPPLSK